MVICIQGNIRLIEQVDNIGLMIRNSEYELQSDSKKYSGEYNKGKKDGIGKYIWQDETMYGGEWKLLYKDLIMLMTASISSSPSARAIPTAISTTPTGT